MEQAVERVKVCAYCRVSTKEDEQLDSYNNQIRFFEREFGERAGYELVEIYRDRGTSGTKLSRPGFDKMILDAGIDKRHIDGDLYRIIDKPKFNRILVKNASRFARNVSADMLLKTLKKNGVFVDFVSSGVSTENNDENIIVNIYLAIAEGESREKSERVRFGIKEGIKRGNIHSHNGIYGYKYYPKPENRLEVREDEAEIVRLIFDLYANRNMGVQRIGEYLTEHGIFTRQGKPFSGRSLLIMLRNETYTGRGVRNKFTNGAIFEKHPTRETGNAVIFETDKVPAIIDMETFEKAQSVLESKVQHQERKGIYTENIKDGLAPTAFALRLNVTSRVLKNNDGIVMAVRAFHRSPLLAGNGDTRPSDLHLHFSRRFSNTDILFHAHTSVGSSNSEYGRSSR